ncbi:urease accessory protein UreD [Kaarinaea lacus]
MNSVVQNSGWRAQLKLAFEQRDARTVISQRQHFGPLVVQKPFYPEGPVCHVYVIHPPGGIVGGDLLTIKTTVNSDAHAVITTPAANKFYRSAGAEAQLTQELTIAKNACLEWLPQETILFNDSAASNNTTVTLHENSRFIGWEITCLGRPASGELFRNGYYRQHFHLYRRQSNKRQQPLFIERAILRGDDALLTATWGLKQRPVTATMLAYLADNDTLQLARSAIEASNNDRSHRLCSATLIDNVLVCRYLGYQAEDAKTILTSIWKKIRPAIMQRKACVPRIWNT